MGKRIDAYLPTVHTDWAELRAICQKGGTLRVRLLSAPWHCLTAASQDANHCFFRHRLTQLKAGTRQVVELTTGADSISLPFQTLTPLPGRKRVSFGIMPDLHIRPFAKSRGLTIPRETALRARRGVGFPVLEASGRSRCRFRDFSRRYRGPVERLHTGSCSGSAAIGRHSLLSHDRQSLYQGVLHVLCPQLI